MTKIQYIGTPESRQEIRETFHVKIDIENGQSVFKDYWGRKHWISVMDYVVKVDGDIKVMSPWEIER